MSGEFREVYAGPLWISLHEAIDAHGDHSVSKALSNLYAAIQPVERACAYCEAGDSDSSDPLLTLLQQQAAIRAAVRELDKLADGAAEIIRAAARAGLHLEDKAP